MKHIMYLLAFLSIGAQSNAQSISANQFTEPLNTGANMTLGLNADALDPYVGSQIGAFNADELCIGLTTISDQFFSMALWGDDTGTPQVEGLLPGEFPTFAILTLDNIVIPIASVNNFSGYVTNALQVSVDISIAGCTDASYLEYHTQGYVADADNGSCHTPTFNFDISPAQFSSDIHTDNNMTIGLNATILNQFEGGTVAAFYDLNGDGILECISAEVIPGYENGANGFFTLSLWGDDEISEEVDGLTSGQVPTFAILTTSNHVIAFQNEEDFSGYAVNAFPSFSEITFDFTIYGCMNESYCNYNPEAEEDDGSCEGLPGCTDDHYVEYNELADCMLENSCSTTWQNAHGQLSSSYDAQLTVNAELTATVSSLETQLETQATECSSSLTNLETQLATETAAHLTTASNLEELNNSYNTQLGINTELTTTISSLETQLETQITESSNTISNLETQLATETAEHLATVVNLEEQLTTQNDECTATINELTSQISELTAPIAIDILEGWNLIGYTLDTEQDVAATLQDIVDYVLIVKNNNAEVYWPEFGFNGIGNFIPGQGYQAKVTQDILGYQYPNVGGLKIENSPTVPQWVIDMPSELHPNDIRTLVKVVNLLGQEVNPEESLKGSTLIYLFNDGTVEKMIKN